MGAIKGEKAVEIDAPIDEVFAIAADVDNSADWQGSLIDVEVLSRHDDGLADHVATVSDAKVKTVKSEVRFSFDAPTSIKWTQIKGDTKSVDGWWRFEDIGGGRTRATYGLEVDPGRMLGMLIRGPVEDQVKTFLLGNAAEGLKNKAEGA